MSQIFQIQILEVKASPAKSSATFSESIFFGIWILEEVKFLLLHFHFCLEQVVASANPEALKKVIVVKLIKKQVETPLSLE